MYPAHSLPLFPLPFFSVVVSSPPSPPSLFLAAYPPPLGRRRLPVRLPYVVQAAFGAPSSQDHSVVVGVGLCAQRR